MIDEARVKADLGTVLDCPGKPGTVALRAQGRYDIEVVIKGRAAHAGIDPERGVSAIQIAARAISGMRLGKIDSETTANIGIINGGSATNIICDRLDLKGEVRSMAGIPALNLAIGMDKMHTTGEYVELKDMIKSIGLVVSIIKNS